MVTTENILDGFALAGTAVFAVSGALMGLRRDMDVIGVAFLAIITGIGGGTIRDLLLGDTPPHWVQHPREIIVCTGVGLATVLINSFMTGRRMTILLWADAGGLALFAALGTAKAQTMGAHPTVAILLGAISASFGGIIRDVICNEVPVLVRREIYITAALASGSIFLLAEPYFDFAISIALGALTGFAIRGLALWRSWSLPPYAGSR